MIQLSWPETAVFLAFLAVSVYGFWFRFGKVWRTVLRSKKDPEFHIHRSAAGSAIFYGK